MQPFPGRPPAPFLNANVTFDDNEVPVDLLIDTGAEVTVLFPSDASRLFGNERYARLPVEYPEDLVPISGVGASAAVELELTVAFPALQGNAVVVRFPVLIMPAPSQQQTLRQPVALPSLLGRDILNRFVLLLNPATDTVELTELSAAPAG